jgi:two-component system nitrogen regulation sensor histidine kinase GlnL
MRQFTIGHVRHRLVTKIEIIDNGPGIPAELQETIFFPMVSGRTGPGHHPEHHQPAPGPDRV